MATKVCDNLSVGILVIRDGKLLVINRKKPPLALAPPAGHIDEHGKGLSDELAQAKEAAIAELAEEVGLTVPAESLALLTGGRKNNPCRRPGGNYHHWYIFLTQNAQGKVQLSDDETKGHLWLTKDDISYLLNGGQFEMADGAVGLEAVWIEWLQEINVLEFFD